MMKKFRPEKVDTIIIHCSDSALSPSVGVSDIRRWHLNRGFDDIGYHFVVRTDGLIEFGRDITFVGAHAAGENSHSVGICYVGGRNSYGNVADTRTFAQKVSIVHLIGIIIRGYYPYIKYIIGHNDVSTKFCPCFDAKSEYKDLVSKFNECFPPSRILEGKTLIPINTNI